MPSDLRCLPKDSHDGNLRAEREGKCEADGKVITGGVCQLLGGGARTLSTVAPVRGDSVTSSPGDGFER